MKLKAIVFALGVSLGTLGQAPAVSKLVPEDFAVAGIREGMNATAVRKTLGRPKSIASGPNPFDRGAKLGSWLDEGLTVRFDGKAVNGTTLTSTAWATKRGLRVGDSEARLLQLYGEPNSRYQTTWEFVDPKDENRVLRVTLTGSRVAKILVGRIVD